MPAPEASAYGIACMTAYESLVIAANIEQHKGKWIYIAGAAGGVGRFVAQIAKLYGLKIIGSAGKTASFNLLRQLRLDHIIDYSKQNVVEEIMNLTGGGGVDVTYIEKELILKAMISDVEYSFSRKNLKKTRNVSRLINKCGKGFSFQSS